MEQVDAEEIRQLVARLARPRSDGGATIERAAIVAAGPDAEAIIAWVTSHHGEPEVLGARRADRGLHGSRLDSGGGTDDRPPLRYVLPPGALEEDQPSEG